MHKAINIGLALLIPVVIIAGEVADWSVGGGTATLVESGGAITLTVDAVVADVTGDVTGNVTSSGQNVKTPTSASVTNGQALTVSADSMILNGIGGANDTTNTITLANPVTIGYEVTLYINGASSNLISLADSGNLKLSAAFLGDNYDNITLYAQETNVWVETGRTDN